MKEHRLKNRCRGAIVAASLLGVVVSGVAVGGTAISAAEEEGFGSNLSVPAIFVPGADAAGAPSLRGGECGSAVDPTGPMSLSYPGYYLQKSEAVWQAECAEVSTLDVTANWGDNLTARPVLSSRQPIRVEVGLEHEPAAAMVGYVVEKLTPELDDRLATYGTRGDDLDFAKVRVFDSGVSLRIERLDGPGGVVYDGPMSAEVNSVGAIVYGYNWGVKGKTGRALPGSYRITFTTNNTRVVGMDASDAEKADFTTNSTSVDISVSASPGLKGSSGSGGSGSGGSGSGGPGQGGSGQGGPR
jgi:uncharacterized membrane protein YgcG